MVWYLVKREQIYLLHRNTAVMGCHASLRNARIWPNCCTMYLTTIWLNWADEEIRLWLVIFSTLEE